MRRLCVVALIVSVGLAAYAQEPTAVKIPIVTCERIEKGVEELLLRTDPDYKTLAAERKGEPPKEREDELERQMETKLKKAASEAIARHAEKAGYPFVLDAAKYLEGAIVYRQKDKVVFIDITQDILEAEGLNLRAND